MKDVVIEWYIPYVISKRQMLIKAVMVSAALVFFIDALVFMAVMLLPSLIIGVTGFFLFRSWRARPQSHNPRRYAPWSP